MTVQTTDQHWEDQFKAALGTAPEPDFKAWCAQNADAVAQLTNPSSTPVALPVPPKRRTLTVLSRWVVASLLIAGGALWLSTSESFSSRAFADTIPGIDGVQSMTWTNTYYIRYTSQDGQRTWVEPERRLHAYRHPGRYRETLLNRQGEPIAIHITDTRAGRMLTLDLKAKKAVLKLPTSHRGERPPFAWVGDEIRERKNGDSLRVKALSVAGRTMLDKTEANVVRAMLQSTSDLSVYRQDLLFDVTSKRLLGIWQPIPNEPKLEFETVIEPGKTVEKDWSIIQPIASLTHEMVLDPMLAATEFSLDPPEGYTLEKQAQPTVTEEEMLAFLGAAARFNDSQFPDSPFDAIDRDKFNAASKKEPASAELKALTEIRDKILMREIFRSPVSQFVDDQTVAGSFHYVGSGVKVGQAERIVGWYRLRNSKQLRAFFGDLSVRDVTEKELPLDVAK